MQAAQRGIDQLENDVGGKKDPDDTESGQNNRSIERSNDIAEQLSHASGLVYHGRKIWFGRAKKTQHTSYRLFSRAAPGNASSLSRRIDRNRRYRLEAHTG